MLWRLRQQRLEPLHRLPWPLAGLVDECREVLQLDTLREILESATYGDLSLRVAAALDERARSVLDHRQFLCPAGITAHESTVARPKLTARPPTTAETPMSQPEGGVTPRNAMFR